MTTKDRCDKHHRKWRYANDPEYRARKRREGNLWNGQNREYWQEYGRQLIENETPKDRTRRLSRVRHNHLQRKYGIGAEDYEVMWQRQGGMCRICGKPETRLVPASDSTVNFLAVDHDSITGQVRGLLCAQCNRAIGLFNHNPDLLRQAADYLERRTALDGLSGPAQQSNF